MQHDALQQPVFPYKSPGCNFFNKKNTPNQVKKFRHIYFELTNICDRKCSFCPAVTRERQYMSPEDAFCFLEQAVEWTDAVYWHLQGEPLLHPEFREITEYASKLGLVLKLTTNASHLKEYSDHLLSGIFYQINFSLQSLNEVSLEERERVRKDIADFSRKALQEYPELYLNFRWWQDEPPDLDYFASYFGIPAEQWLPVSGRRNRRVIGRLYTNFDGQFEWPDPSSSPREQGEKGGCYGLIDHCGILCDGRVVPCCLDSHGALSLGNLHETALSEILNSPLALAIENGFRKNCRVMKQCQSCGYAARFDV